MKKMVLAICAILFQNCLSDVLNPSDLGNWWNSDTYVYTFHPVKIRVMDVYTHYDYSAYLITPSEYFEKEYYNNGFVIINSYKSETGESWKVKYSNIVRDSIYDIDFTENSNFKSVFLGDIDKEKYAIDGELLTQDEYIKHDRPYRAFHCQCTRIVGFWNNGRWEDQSGNDISNEFIMHNERNSGRTKILSEQKTLNVSLKSNIKVIDNVPQISFDIVYSGEKIVWGKKTLNDAEWVDVTDEDKSEYKFFKVTLKSL